MKREPMRKTVPWLALPVALLLGCGGARSYDTRVVYDAVANGYRLEVATKGRLPEGEDLNLAQVGTVKITPLAGAQPTVTLDLAGGPTVSCTVGAAAPVSSPWGEEGERRAALLDALTKAGYKVASPAEAEESVAAISAALLGPKTTLMPGQTKALKVVRVTFH
jgi:hypothetical protein